ncbi:tRNA A37 threonylcarbamoyladenosine dehydratase [Prosthecobacter fusiformis]|uniref:tRNA A37 threonylcarbamoyladenosine dehydratase n=1 Tax=Prosthecobacter fusiformis TaxID=48464 RepID=A0A4V3FFK1_9BACT|nr:tRNA threonylcarbamoyladenosine dehydratase [Prosthecobacter fusiformis]TDU71043.1 tRNA A37 threonylcarbamoyladenosine dehydratase [Prosthecobacter fusiformis]
MTESYLQRFGGIGRLYGVQALARLHGARVAVIGVGGVGSWAVEALARSGVGSLTLIDMDDVCITNTNRQLPALSHTVGHPKVAVLARRVVEIYPECQIHAVTEFFLENNADRLLASGFDCLVDAVDSTNIKALIISKARALNLPVVVSGSAGGRRDPTQVKVADLGQAGADPLLLQVRRRLREAHGFPKSLEGKPMHWEVPCVYSTEKAVYPQADGSCSTEREVGTEAGLRLDCAAGFGAATFVTGTFGFALAAEVLKILVADKAT